MSVEERDERRGIISTMQSRLPSKHEDQYKQQIWTHEELSKHDRN